MSAAVADRGELAAAVAFAAQVLPKRPAVPVLGGMLVTVDAGRVTVAAFDYETSARAVAGAETDGACTVLADGRELAAAVKALPRPKGRGKTLPVMLGVSADGVTLECDGVTMTVAGMGEQAQAEYPQLPPMPAERGVADAAVFVKAVTRVAACAGKDYTLPALTCVHAEMTAGSLRLAATDRYRLAVDDMPWTAAGEEALEALIPAKPLVMFAKACGKTGKVHVHADGPVFDDQGHAQPARAGFSDGTRQLTVMLNSGTFPRYRSLVRDEGGDSTLITVDAAQLAAAVDRAGTVTGRGEPPIRRVIVDAVREKLDREDAAAAEAGWRPGRTEEA